MGIFSFINKFRKQNSMLHISIDFNIVGSVRTVRLDRCDNYIEDAINIKVGGLYDFL